MEQKHKMRLRHEETTYAQEKISVLSEINIAYKIYTQKHVFVYRSNQWRHCFLYNMHVLFLGTF